MFFPFLVNNFRFSLYTVDFSCMYFFSSFFFFNFFITHIRTYFLWKTRNPILHNHITITITKQNGQTHKCTGIGKRKGKDVDQVSLHKNVSSYIKYQNLMIDKYIQYTLLFPLNIAFITFCLSDFFIYAHIKKLYLFYDFNIKYLIIISKLNTY